MEYPYYAESEDGRFRFTAWSPPPAQGDGLCLGLTGRTEARLVEDILAGQYDHLLSRKGTTL